jgi:hypothetical protein
MDASDKLYKLAGRAKQAEQKATEAKRQAKADLEVAVAKSRTSAQAQATKLRETARASKGDLSSWWDEQQQAWNTHIERMRRTVDEKKAEHEAMKVERRAEHAEADASFAIDFAFAAIEEAEYAVLDAILARETADEQAPVGAGS